MVQEYTVNGRRYRVTVECLSENMKENDMPEVLRTLSLRDAPQYHPAQIKTEEKDGTVRSTLPGLVSSVGVKIGDRVKRGAPLCVVEAMKMENEMFAPFEGIVHDIFVKENDHVQADAPLIFVLGRANE